MICEGPSSIYRQSVLFQFLKHPNSPYGLSWGTKRCDIEPQRVGPVWFFFSCFFPFALRYIAMEVDHQILH